ncbi:MAG: hypothetical protein HPY59_03870 [Anaerolineae bacterium]|nr:hypothetical protein [Anaerolineae bacterium]
MKKYTHFFMIVLVACAILARVIPCARTIDDSYITYRYARNILTGNGFVFNPGEYVQGTTTPLYTILMTGLGFFWGGSEAPFPQIALIVNALADSATCLLLFSIGKRLGYAIGGAATGLAWAIAPFSVTFAVGGLETSVYIFLLTGSIWAHLAKRRKIAAAFAIMSLLTRPDAILLVGPLFIHRLYQAKFAEEKISAAEAMLFLIPGIAWGMFAWLYFGSPIPHSVQAKLEVYRLESFSSFIRLVQHYALIFMQDLVLGPIIGTGIGLILVPFLFVTGSIKAVKTDSAILPYALYPWLYLVVFSIPNPLIFRWYLAPPTSVLYLFVLMGAEKLCMDIFHIGMFKEKTRLRKWLVGIIVIAFPLLLNINGWEIRPDHGPGNPSPGMAWIKLELLYYEAASIVSPLMTEDTLLAAGDVGVLGFYTPARILDTVGLNSPQSLEYYPIPQDEYVINYAIPTQLILQEKPDWIIILEVYGRNTFLRNKDFHDRYKLWKTLPTDIYGSKGLLLFRKVPFE